MAKQILPTNFQDDQLSQSMGGVRQYKITKTDGTSEIVTIEDVTDYDKIGNEFGAEQINATNTAVNASADAGKIIDSLDAIKATTQAGYMAGALALKELGNDLTNSIDELNTSLATASSPSTVSALSYSSIAGIKEDTNLNDLNNPGFYAVSSSAWATLAKNYPVAGLGGAVEVLRISDVGSCIQKYYGFGGYSPNVRIFCRHLYKQANGEEYWSPWVEYTYNEVK